MENPQSRYFSKCTIFDEVHCYWRNGERKVRFLLKFYIFGEGEVQCREKYKSWESPQIQGLERHK